MTSKKFYCRNCKKAISEEEAKDYLKIGANDFIMSHASVVCQACLAKRRETIRQNRDMVTPIRSIDLDNF